MLRIVLSILVFSFYLNQTFSQQDFPFVHFGLEEGLSSLNVNDILQDFEGFIWVATSNGLNRFDGKTFKVFTSNPKDTTSLSGRIVLNVVEQGNHLWIATSLNGINILNKKTLKVEAVIYIPIPLYESRNCEISFVFKDRKNQIWAGTNFGLFLFEKKSHQFIQKYPAQPDRDYQARGVNNIYEDPQGIFWMGTGGKGVLRFDSKNQDYQDYKYFDQSLADPIYQQNVVNIFETEDHHIYLATASGLCSLDKENKTIKPLNLLPPSEPLFDIIQTKDGMIWIAAWERIIAYDPKTKRLKSFRHKDFQLNSISKGHYNCLFQDRAGSLWIGGENGINILHPKQINSINTSSVQLPKLLLESEESRAIFATDKALWLGIKKSMVRYDFASKTQKEVLPIKPLKLFEDSKRNVWVASADVEGIFKFDEDGNLLLHIPTSAKTKMESSLTTKNELVGGITFDIKEDHLGNMWFGSLGGVHCYIPEKDSLLYFGHYPNDTTTISSPDVMSLYIDSNHRLWVGTFNEGLNVMDLNRWYKTNKIHFDRYALIEGDSTSLSNNSVRGIIEDADHNIWVYTMLGVNKYLSKTDSFKQYIDYFSRANIVVSSGLLSTTDHLWFSTDDHGLICYNKNKDTFINYTKEDGLKHRSFLRGPIAQGKYGTFILGSQTGIEVIKESQLLETNQYLPPVQLTHLKIKNRKDIHQIWQQKEPLILKHKQNEITFSFAVLNYIIPNKNQYQCKLEGYDEDWRQLGNKNEITYNNLNSGDYNFKVKGANNDGLWNEQSTDFSFAILSPWWKRTWAYLIYVLLLSGLVWGFYRFQLNQQLEREKIKRMRELDKVKARFYTNITHEFRTPLTLIIGPANKAKNNIEQYNKSELLESFRLIEQNGHILLDRVNQLLDLSKIESGIMKTSFVHGNIIMYLKYMLESFQSFADSKNINLHFESKISELYMDYDKEKLLTIISNLIFNAIKFTPNNENVKLKINISEKSPNKRKLNIKISDTGQGIAAENLPFIFDRFYQVDDSEKKEVQGSGIGLALVKELVELLDGEIFVHSVLGKGTIFTLDLLIRQTAKAENTEEQISFEWQEGQGRNMQLKDQLEGEQAIILIIEDNKDVAFYIASCLQKNYRLVFASDGQQGINKALEFIPDFIISDVMMPKMNGFEVCKSLKSNMLTNHIPIMLLTAKANEDAKLIGLKRGADVYLTKPFNEIELLLRIEKMIAQRNLLQEKYSKQILKNMEAPVLSISKDKFLERLETYIEVHLADTNLDVNSLCKEMGTSRTQLHRKVTGLTNQSITRLVRKIRLEKAKQLLIEEPELTISEIAYNTGFNDPAYFSRLFSEDYNENPSSFREKYTS